MTALGVFIIVFAIFALGVVAGGTSKPSTNKSYAQRKPPVYVRKR